MRCPLVLEPRSLKSERQQAQRPSEGIVNQSIRFARLPLTAEVELCLGQDGVCECGLGHQAVQSLFQPRQ